MDANEKKENIGPSLYDICEHAKVLSQSMQQPTAQQISLPSRKTSFILVNENTERCQKVQNLRRRNLPLESDTTKKMRIV